MKVAIIGAGYVGLVTGVGLAHRGHEVLCHDVDAGRLAPLRDAKAPFFEPDLDSLLQQVVAKGTFAPASSLAEALRDADASIIAVGTPSTEQGIDLAYIRAAAAAIGAELPRIGRYHTVVVKSTVVPGTTDTLVQQTLEQTSGLKAGKDFGLGMVPEFLREGCAVADFMNPDRVVVGSIDARSGAVMAELFAAPGCPILRTTLRNAEMTKYAANALLATLISFSNEITSLCEAIPGLDEEQVMAGLHLDRRFTIRKGEQLFQPGLLSYLRGGIGFGGSCFPKDVKALHAFAIEHNAPHAMLDAVLKTNKNRADAVVSLLERAIGPLMGKRIVVAGLAFKENTDDTRESPGIRLADALSQRGADVVVHDPLVDGATQKFAWPVEVAVTLAAALKGAEACVIATRWPDYIALDWQQAVRVMAAPVVLDGRQVVPPTQRGAPLIYLPIGAAAQTIEAEATSQAASA